MYALILNLFLFQCQGCEPQQQSILLQGKDTAGNPHSYLYNNGKLVGGYELHNRWRSFDGAQWTEPATQKPKPTNCRCNPNCPCHVCRCKETTKCVDDCTCTNAIKKPEPPTGVESSEIGKQGERYTVNGHPITKEEALNKVTQLPDDSQKLRLTIIGFQSDRDKVLADINGNTRLRELKPELVIQDYDPDAPLIRNLGFVTGGKPTIYLQEPNGRVLLRQDSYETADALYAAIRKADPKYDPSRDPNGTTLGPSLFKKIPPAAWLVGLATIVIFLWRK